MPQFKLNDFSFRKEQRIRVIPHSKISWIYGCVAIQHPLCYHRTVAIKSVGAALKHDIQSFA
jgi:hypothetical protein